MKTLNLHTSDGVILRVPGVGVMMIYVTDKTPLPSNGDSGYAPGCIAIDTVNGKMYKNEGTLASALFAAIASLTAAQEAVMDELSASELGYLDESVPGIWTALKTVIPDASGEMDKVQGDIVEVGADGDAGEIHIYPQSSSKGKFRIKCADQLGDTNVNLTADQMSGVRNFYLRDSGAANSDIVSHADIAVGDGISEATGVVCEHHVTNFHGLIKTEILIDLTGLNSSETSGDIIGKLETSNPCHFGQIVETIHGTIIGGRIMCLEAPDSNTDIDLYCATVGTGKEDDAIADLVETQLIDHGPWSAGDIDELSALPPNQEYLYLVDQTGAAVEDDEYSAGIFLIELWGIPA